MAADETTRTGTDRIATHDGNAHLLVISQGAARRVPLPPTGQLVIGRGGDCELALDDDAASRRHAALSSADGVVSIADLGSHNGTRVNGERVDRLRRLAAGDVVQIGDVVIVLCVAPRVERRSMLDDATLRQRLDQEIERAAAFGREVGVLLIAGPDPIAIVRAVEPALSSIDLVAELGTAIAIVTPEVDREAVAALASTCMALLPPTARAGIATCPDDGADAGALLAGARAALDQAGPGQVVDAVTSVHHVELGDRVTLIADPAMVRILGLIRRIAHTELTVLVRGETGSGKEHVARALHDLGPRAAQPFVTLNCAAVQDTLVESELFGHDKGAFSGATQNKPGLFEIAAGGTILLDEVGELSPAMQAKLLRAIEAKRITRVGSVVEREIDLRVVAATHRDLEAESRAGRFRQDLYFRLCGATIAVPPLRERPREIALLAHRFCSEACARLGRPSLRLTAGAMRALSRYAWPGNVRELRNVIEYVVATASPGQMIEAWQLPAAMAGVEAEPAVEISTTIIAPVRFRALAEELRELEVRRMREAIESADGVLKHAARLIGMPLRTFHLKAKQYGLTARRSLP